MTLIPLESASFAGSANAMEPKARVNSLSSLALAALDSSIIKSDTTSGERDSKPTATTSLFSATSSRVSATNGTSMSSPEVVSAHTSGTPIKINIHQAPHSATSSTSSMVAVMPPSQGNRRRASANTGSQLGRRKSWDQRFSGPIRRASQVIISLTNPGIDGASLYGECSRRDSRIMPEIMLMHSSFQRLPMKDFGAEVRASMDVDQFLQQAVLLLDITETSLDGIVDRMLRKVCLLLLLIHLSKLCISAETKSQTSGLLHNILILNMHNINVAKI